MIISLKAVCLSKHKEAQKRIMPLIRLTNIFGERNKTLLIKDGFPIKEVF